jgi:CheY-like chemotaxis protein
LKFLLADDSEIPLQYLTRIIKRLGHEVAYTATNGAEAVDIGRTHPDIDVAIIYISMPVMTGTEAARIFVREKLARYVLIASSNSQTALVATMRDIGCGFIAKPYEPEQMAKFLVKWIPELQS